jgi:hypothetical protein
VYVCVCVSVQLYESRALLTHSYTRTLNVLSSVSRSSQKRHSLTPSASAKDSHVWLVWYGVAVHMRVCVYKYVCVCVCCQYACINIYIEMCVCVCVCVCVCMCSYRCSPRRTLWHTGGTCMCMCIHAQMLVQRE